MVSQLFTLKVLSTSPDAAVRRLRGFAASIGGRAELLSPCEFDASTVAQLTSEKTLLLIDANSVEAKDILAKLPAVLPESLIIFALIPSENRDCPQWTNDPRVSGTLVGGAITSLENASIRCALGKIITSGCAPEASTFLRWGYASSLWTPARKSSITEASIEFMNNLAIFGQSKSAHSAFINELSELGKQTTLTRADNTGAVISALVATDGINCLSSVTLRNCNHLFNAGLPAVLAQIDTKSGTILSLEHSCEIIEVSLVRPINGQTRRDGKSTIARPASYIRLLNPTSQQDGSPNVSIVWTEAG